MGVRPPLELTICISRLADPPPTKIDDDVSGIKNFTVGFTVTFGQFPGYWQSGVVGLQG